MIQKSLRYYHAIRNLKPDQIINRVLFPARLRAGNYRMRKWLQNNAKGAELLLLKSPNKRVEYEPPGTFTFLNRTHAFSGEIPWNFSAEGKLWQYHLGYFDYLNQPDLTKEEGLRLIDDFISAMDRGEIQLEPYPLSLRCVNWIKFINRNEIRDPNIDRTLYAQFCFLKRTLESHLMGNHLLENLLAMLWGALFFQEKAWFDRTEPLLRRELREQILEDGSHLERSPMYHLIILERILDAINLIGHNYKDETLLEDLLRSRASIMLGWLDYIGFSNGELPAVNDSARDQMRPADELILYAGQLQIETAAITPGSSGYRMIKSGKWELFIDAGNIGPDYNPGHSHCDTLSFLLYHQNKPVVVDPAVSTYENGERRWWERSTAAHNTVQPNGAEQSDMWGAFRVGRRAHAQILNETETEILATHDGFKNQNTRHKRQWKWDADSIYITDQIESDYNLVCKAHAHFHPDCKVEVQGNTIKVDNVLFKFNHHKKIELEEYRFALGFNRLVESNKCIIYFHHHLITEITSQS